VFVQISTILRVIRPFTPYYSKFLGFNHGCFLLVKASKGGHIKQRGFLSEKFFIYRDIVHCLQRYSTDRRF